jgi:hypothetical protein
MVPDKDSVVDVVGVVVPPVGAGVDVPPPPPPPPQLLIAMLMASAHATAIMRFHFMGFI